MATNGYAYWIVAKNLDEKVAWLVGPIYDPIEAQVLFGAVRDEAWLHLMDDDCITWVYGVARAEAIVADQLPVGQLNDVFLPQASTA